MAQPMRDEIVRYFDEHPTREDLMGETLPHARLVHYVMEVITWLLHRQVCAIYENFNFYQTPDENEYPLAPDIAIIKGIPALADRSYWVGTTGPAPQLVFEFASKETWKRDLQEKPGEYDRMGVMEYYAYDPNPVMLPLSRRRGRRIFGWHRERASDTLRELLPDEQGRLWSPLLQSFLVPDGAYLRLYDRFSNRRLTQAEQEAQRANEEAQRADEQARRAEILAEKLRALGIDPDQLA